MLASPIEGFLQQQKRATVSEIRSYDLWFKVIMPKLVHSFHVLVFELTSF